MYKRIFKESMIFLLGYNGCCHAPCTGLPEVTGVGTPAGTALLDDDDADDEDATEGSVGAGISKFFSSSVSHRCTDSSDFRVAANELSFKGAGNIDFSASLAL